MFSNWQKGAMNRMSRLHKKTAIVTGGTEGIGKATVRRLAEEGARVAFCGRRLELGYTVEAEFRSAGMDVTFFPCDVSDVVQIGRFVVKSLELLGTLDIIVCNAGGGRALPWPEHDDENWEGTLRLNLDSVYHLCRLCWPHMTNTGGGSIVAISSLSAWGAIGQTQLQKMGGRQPNPAYQVAKAGLEGLVIHLAGRGGEHGIRVNAVRPGRILTEKWENVGENALFWGLYKDIQILKRQGEPIDVANAVLYLASDESKFVTGTFLDVSGGAIGRL